MQTEIPIGTPITYHDEPIGSIEGVEHDRRSGQVQAFIVRSGRSPSLLRIGATAVEPDGGGGYRLAPGVELDTLEREAIDSGRLPPEGAHLDDAGPTEPAPNPQEALGPESGLPTSYDGPATG